MESLCTNGMFSCAYDLVFGIGVMVTVSTTVAVGLLTLKDWK